MTSVEARPVHGDGQCDNLKQCVYTLLGGPIAAEGVAIVLPSLVLVASDQCASRISLENSRNLRLITKSGYSPSLLAASQFLQLCCDIYTFGAEAKGLVVLCRPKGSEESAISCGASDINNL